jgi:hypothetical protein
MPASKIHNSVNILFIRDIKENTDDKILIRPTDTDDCFYLRYTDALNKSSHELYLSADQIRQYFLSLFSLVSYDTQPFESVQVNFPAFPCVVLAVKDLGYESVRLRLQSIVDFTLKTSYAPEEYEEEEDEADEHDHHYHLHTDNKEVGCGNHVHDDDTVYDDMPDLEYAPSDKLHSHYECETGHY